MESDDEQLQSIKNSTFSNKNLGEHARAHKIGELKGDLEPTRDEEDEAKQHTRKMVESEITRKTERGKPWHDYNSPVVTIEKELESVGFFKKFLESRKRKGGKVLVMDIMGQGGFLEDPDCAPYIDSELAVTLLDFRDEEQKQRDEQIGKEVIAGKVSDETSWEDGDVTGDISWEKIDAFLSKHDKDGYDLITCAPVRGRFSLLSPSGNVEGKMIRRCIDRLNPDGGRLEYGCHVGPKIQSKWLERIRETEGLVSEYLPERGILKVTKNLL